MSLLDKNLVQSNENLDQPLLIHTICVFNLALVIKCPWDHLSDIIASWDHQRKDKWLENGMDTSLHLISYSIDNSILDELLDNFIHERQSMEKSTAMDWLGIRRPKIGK